MSDTSNINNNTSNLGKTVAKTAALMTVLTLVSKCLGFVREMVIAVFFGTSYIVDAYVMAQSIPGMLFGGIFSSIGTAYMPAFSSIVEKNGRDAGNRFTNEILNLSMILAVIAFGIGALFAEQLVAVIAPKFAPETAALTTFYLRISFSYMIFSCGISIFSAYLQYKGNFLKPIISGYFQNLGIVIIAAVSAYTNYYYLAFGMLVGYALRYLFIFIAVKKEGYQYEPKIVLNEPVKQIMVLAVPVFIGSCISQLNNFVDKTLASGLQEGSISALNYGMMLVSLITGLTTSVIASIIYPKITKARSNDDWTFFNTAVERGMTVVMIIGIPFGLGAMVFAEDVVQIVYERGAFDEAATALTGTAFLYYASGLVFIALRELLTYVYYSVRDMKTPVICGAVGVAVNIILSLMLVGKMAHGGLALATSIATAVNVVMQYFLLIRKYREIKIFRSKQQLVKIIIASVIAVGTAFGVHRGLIAVVWMPRFVYLGIVVAVSCLVYLAMLAALKVDEIKILKAIVEKTGQ